MLIDQLFSHREQLANKQRQASGEEGAAVEEASAGGANDSATTPSDATNNAKNANGATPAHTKVSDNVATECTNGMWDLDSCLNR